MQGTAGLRTSLTKIRETSYAPPKTKIIKVKNMDFEYNQFKPRRVWLDKFSRKPHPLKVLFYTLLVLGAILLLGHLALKGLDNGNRQRCENWNETAKVYKQKGYQMAYTVPDIEMCKSAGVELMK